jgi:hypothetical protein
MIALNYLSSLDQRVENQMQSCMFILPVLGLKARWYIFFRILALQALSTLVQRVGSPPHLAHCLPGVMSKLLEFVFYLIEVFAKRLKVHTVIAKGTGLIEMGAYRKQKARG